MKETRFIEQNKEKWLKFEQLLRLNRRDPDKLSDLFVQVTDDLSYARTNYPNRSIKVYLNNVAQQLFYNIYKNKKDGRNKFVRFWREELPAIVYHSRMELIVSLVVFLLAVTIGVISSMHDSEFARSILGDSYVDTTIKNIEDGDPMGIYKDMNEVDMFLYITRNNVTVAFYTFISGIFLSLGAVIVLVYNGIMVGVFQYFFIERDLGIESFLTIWLHGTLEISSIVIAGGAGIVLGTGLIFPGTYSRLRAFQMSARRALKLLIGIVPILVFAAMIESFVTRYTELPVVAKLALILVSLFFVLFYFVWYPFVKHRNGTLIKLDERNLQSREVTIPRLEGNIRKVSQIFRDALIMYQKLFKYYFKPLALASVLYVAVAAYILYSQISSFSIYTQGWLFSKLEALLNYQDFPVLFLLNTAFLTGVIYWTYYRASELLEFDYQRKTLFLGAGACAVIMNLPFFADGFLSVMLWLVMLVVACFSMFIYLKEDRSFLSAMGGFRIFYIQSTGRITGLFSLLLLIAFIFFVLLSALSTLPFFGSYLDFITSNFVMEGNTSYYITLAVKGFLIALCIGLLMPLFLLGSAIQYFTLQEIKDAAWLKQQIATFERETND